jgi:hypothetical protein
VILVSVKDKTQKEPEKKEGVEGVETSIKLKQSVCRKRT